MKNRAFVAGVVLAGLTSTTALAQNTVGEVLDAGGKKLSKVELVPLLVGSNVSGPTQGGGEMQVDYKADGTLGGNVHTADGKNASRYGTWTVDDSGMFCVVLTTSGRINSEMKSCGFVFSVGNQYFASLDTDDRGARVLSRTIKK